MRRIVWVLLSALLVAELSGAAALLTPETCRPGEAGTQPDATCPPTCARCRCCAQPVVQADLQLICAVEPIAPFSSASAVAPPVLLSHDILHVPKRS